MGGTRYAAWKFVRTGYARDRIGKGPWHNAKGVLIAKNIDKLHSTSNNLTKETALTEKGEIVSGRGHAVNQHDILTGSDPNGLYSTAGVTESHILRITSVCSL